MVCPCLGRPTDAFHNISSLRHRTITPSPSTHNVPSFFLQDRKSFHHNDQTSIVLPSPRRGGVIRHSHRTKHRQFPRSDRWQDRVHQILRSLVREGLSDTMIFISSAGVSVGRTWRGGLLWYIFFLLGIMTHLGLTLHPIRMNEKPTTTNNVGAATASQSNPIGKN